MPSKSKTEPILWGTSRYKHTRVQLFLAPCKPDYIAETSFTDGVPCIYFRASLLQNAKRLRRILIHEFTHVIEYMNDPSNLSAVTVENCTALAQTMEVGMADLICNLRIKNVKFRW